MARLKAHIWVSAFVLAQNNAHRFTAIGKKGDADAGAIYIKIVHANRTATLMGPAMWADDAYDRTFEIVLQPHMAEAEIDAYLKKQQGWDRDCWVIEVACDDIEMLGLPLFKK